MSNKIRIPFSEIVERVQNDLLRDTAQNDASEYKYKGAVNDVYMSDFITLLPEDYLRTEASITTWPDYATGTVALTNGSAGIVPTGGSWDTLAPAGWVAGTDTMLFKANGYDEVYRLQYVGAAAANLDRAWVEATDTSESYRIVQDRYALASDFSHMVMDDKDDPEAVYYYQNGARTYLEPMDNGEFEKDALFNYGIPNQYTVKWVNGSPYMFIAQPDDSAHTLKYNYIPTLSPLSEYTTGTITTLANGGTAVTGSGTDFDGYIDSSYSYYFRLDRDGTGSASKWYAVSSAGSNTALTLTDAYGGTAVSTATLAYTIAMVPRWPARFDTAMIYGAALRIAPTNTEAVRWMDLYNKIIPAQRAIDAKRIYGQSGAFKRRR